MVKDLNRYKPSINRVGSIALIATAPIHSTCVAEVIPNPSCNSPAVGRQKETGDHKNYAQSSDDLGTPLVGRRGAGCSRERYARCTGGLRPFPRPLGRQIGKERDCRKVHKHSFQKPLLYNPNLEHSPFSHIT